MLLLLLRRLLLVASKRGSLINLECLLILLLDLLPLLLVRNKVRMLLRLSDRLLRWLPCRGLLKCVARLILLLLLQQLVLLLLLLLEVVWIWLCDIVDRLLV